LENNQKEEERGTMFHCNNRYWHIWHWHSSISPLVAILRHYIKIVWHYGWHSLQSQIADYIANLMYTIKHVFWKCLRAAASNAYSFAGSAG
jgi:hypothetical protein